MSNYSVIRTDVAFASDETKRWLSLSAKQRRNPCSGPSTVYQDLSTHHDWPVKIGIVDLPIRSKGKSKVPSGNSLSPMGAHNKVIGAASQPFLRDRPSIYRLGGSGNGRVEDLGLNKVKFNRSPPLNVTPLK